MTDRYERGAARIAELTGRPDGPRREAYDALADLAPDLARYAVEFAYGDIHSRPGLDAARRELVILGALVALGDCRPQLEAHLDNGLTAGLSQEEIVEAVMQALPYAGFPRVFNAMAVVRKVLADRPAADPSLAADPPPPADPPPATDLSPATDPSPAATEPPRRSSPDTRA
ncbi:carboxymuconolactone decarboxylase family protein [Solihabitans fulvus]|uniref:carboxymuconolactone decarboxylase family protein n=1 Tax=Solihabitans fulvus TaxID=1892852 RepID=UPI001CB7632C|nr:carboxymuconolactone decarboxylase family protein [Solihabitans fulvus]